MCAASIDGEYSLSEFRAVRKIAEADDISADEVGPRELLLGDEEDPDLPLSLEAELDVVDLDEMAAAVSLVVTPDDEAANQQPGPAASDDGRVGISKELLEQLEYRAAAFGERYPFTLVGTDGLRIRAPLTPEHRLYLFLVLASNLKYLTKTKANAVTTCFELLSPHVLRSHLGPNAEVHIFGTSARSGVDRYSGSLWDRLTTLKQDIRLQIHAARHEIDSNLAGDNGLDVVGWLVSEDSAARLMIVFGQCACGRSWQSKMHEASADHWAPVFTITVPVVNVLFIPYCARTADGTWFNEYQIPRGVLFDRERIMSRVSAAVLSSCESPENIVAELLSEELV